MKRLTLHEFKLRGNKFHNNKYDYSISNYSGSNNPIDIICPTHGVFSIKSAVNHITPYGQGCPNCKKFIKKTIPNIDQFKLEANQLYNNKYDYSKTTIKGNKVPIIIICPTHGEFSVLPLYHLGGRGCSKCKNRNMSNDTFIKSLIEMHGTKYDYSLVQYKNSTTKIDIICNIHGVFSQLPREHKNGSNCPKCVGRYKTTTEFILESNLVHNYKYSYIDTIYKYSEEKVKIICLDHGEFFQTPYSHLKGSGCSKCSKNSSRSENEWLDYLGIPLKDRQIKLKVVGYKKELIVDGFYNGMVYEFLGDLWHGNPKIYNRDDICGPNKKKFGILYDNTMKRKEKILQMGYSYEHIWELDWKILKTDPKIIDILSYNRKKLYTIKEDT